MPASELLKLAGLAALLASALYMVAGLAKLANLLSQLLFGQAIVVLLLVSSFVVLLAQVLLVLGLVGLYVRQSEEAGLLGFAGLPLALMGLVWVTGNAWAVLLLFLGCALLGASSLRARVYPRLAAMLFLGSALLGVVVVGAFIASGPSVVLALISICVDLIFNVAVGWLGYSLWRGEAYKLDTNAGLGSEDLVIRSYSE